MIHQPSAGTQGQITDMAIHLKRLENVKTRMNRILSENTGKSIEEVTAACERDNFLNAEEAKAFGLMTGFWSIMIFKRNVRCRKMARTTSEPPVRCSFCGSRSPRPVG